MQELQTSKNDPVFCPPYIKLGKEFRTSEFRCPSKMTSSVSCLDVWH